MLYQIPPMYRDRSTNIRFILMTILFILPILILIVGNKELSEGQIALLLLNIIVPFAVFLFIFAYYYPLLLRTYGTQTFYSSESHLIRENRVGPFKFRKKWEIKNIKSVRKNIEIQEVPTKEPDQSQIMIATRLLIEKNDGTTEVLLKADDIHLNGLIHELKLAGFNTKGLMHQAFDKAKELFDRFTAGDLR